MDEILANFDGPPPKYLSPPGWTAEDISNREGATIAADYWEEIGGVTEAKWLRDWAYLSPDDHERFRRRLPSAVCGWGRNTKFAKIRRSRIERAACRLNPDVPSGYGINNIY